MIPLGRGYGLSWLLHPQGPAVFLALSKEQLRQGFLAPESKTHLLLFPADLWEVDMTLMAQQCC